MAIAEYSFRRKGVPDAGRDSGSIVARTVSRLPVALAAAIVLLLSVLVVAMMSAESRQLPASGPPFVVGGISDAARIFGENLLVLSLYAMGNIAALLIKRWRACEGRAEMLSREFVSRLATATVIGLLLFATFREAYALGHGLAVFSGYFYASPWRLWLGVLPHAMLELTGICRRLRQVMLVSTASRHRSCGRATVSGTALVAVRRLGTITLSDVWHAPVAKVNDARAKRLRLDQLQVGPFVQRREVPCRRRVAPG